jgi:hypothetical protein
MKKKVFLLKSYQRPQKRIFKVIKQENIPGTSIFQELGGKYFA